jgi:hypothetical protein
VANECTRAALRLAGLTTEDSDSPDARGGLRLSAVAHEIGCRAPKTPASDSDGAVKQPHSQAAVMSQLRNSSRHPANISRFARSVDGLAVLRHAAASFGLGERARVASTPYLARLTSGSLRVLNLRLGAARACGPFDHRAIVRGRRDRVRGARSSAAASRGLTARPSRARRCRGCPRPAGPSVTRRV